MQTVSLISCSNPNLHQVYSGSLYLNRLAFYLQKRVFERALIPITKNNLTFKFSLFGYLVIWLFSHTIFTMYPDTLGSDAIKKSSKNTDLSVNLFLVMGIISA